MSEPVNLGGHPCVPNTQPKAPSDYRCQRCGTAEAWDTSRCLPGMTVHLPPNTDHRHTHRRFWLASGFHIDDAPSEHRPFVPCMQCYDTAIDPAMHPVTEAPPREYSNPAVTAAPGTLVLLAGTWTRVLWTIDWPPGTHEGYAPRIPDHWWARQVVTAAGSRWLGHAPGQRYEDAVVSLNAAAGGISFEHGDPEPRLRPPVRTHATAQLPTPTGFAGLVIDTDPPRA